jgi:hypothetical protein
MPIVAADRATAALARLAKGDAPVARGHKVHDGIGAISFVGQIPVAIDSMPGLRQV